MPTSSTMRLFIVSMLLFACTAGAAGKPNFLVIIADDCTFNDLPLYGGQNAKTPNIDALAKQGLTFNRAYLSEAMCQPCRSELYSGMFPLRNGSAWNHSASRPDITTMPHHLRKLGYRVGLAGKTHVKPEKAFPFKSVGGFDPNCVRTPTQNHDIAQSKQFMQEGEKPFCLVIALVEPHVPWVMGDPSQYPEDQLKLPPHIADTAVTRNAFSRYLAEITYMDGQVGEILQALEETGKADDTMVLFTSEQGAQFPGCKWTNWDLGLHTALIARWPGKTPTNKRTDAIVQYADVLPTLVDIAGGKPANHNYDGTSFQEVLKGKTHAHREYAYGIHNNVPEGPPYPIRTITNGEFRYIRNLRPDEIYIEKHLMGIQGDGRLNNPYWSTWVFNSQQDARTYELVKRYTLRPAEEFYHTAKDPFEKNNLAGNIGLGRLKHQLSEELDRWMASQGDPGAPQDTDEALKASRKGEHLYFPKD